MNVEDVRKDSKYCKRSATTAAISNVRNAELIDPRGSYPFLAQVRLNLRIAVQLDQPERTVRRWDTSSKERLRRGKIKFKRGLEEPSD